jgi:hypothetical protein
LRWSGVLTGKSKKGRVDKLVAGVRVSQTVVDSDVALLPVDVDDFIVAFIVAFNR